MDPKVAEALQRVQAAMAEAESSLQVRRCGAAAVWLEVWRIDAQRAWQHSQAACSEALA